MIIGCPRCSRRFRVNDAREMRSELTFRCTSCATVFRLPPPATDCGTDTGCRDLAATTRPRVLVAHESPAFCAAVQQILASEPWDVTICHDGITALEQIPALGARVVLIDVALPGRFGFEVCEQLRSDPATAGTKILLFASIYDRTRYKRMPASLYGADDYIEKHHIPDLLAAKIKALLANSEEPVTPTHAPKGMAHPAEPEVEEARTLLRQEEESTTVVQEVASLPEALVKARRLARIIVSDIALYNQVAVQDGVRTGTFFTLLADDIAEGRALYERRVSADIRAATAYLDDAFADLITRIKKEMGF